MAYDPDMAKLLMLCSNICYEQFDKGQEDPDYDGSINVLPSYSLVPPEYTQVASLKARDFTFIDRTEANKEVLHSPDFNAEDEESLEKLSGAKTKFFGFVLKSDKQNIVAFRGTMTNQEWLVDFTGVQVPVPLRWFGDECDLKVAKMHLGFLIQYSVLLKQVNESVSQLDKSLPIYTTGHSLGAALAVVASVVIRVLNYPITGKEKVRMINFAGPRVGNDAFIGAYNFLVPHSYRVVNLTDLVPMLPPSALTIGKVSIQYGHVGTEYAYLWQRGDIRINHTNIDNYTIAVDKEVPTDKPLPNAPTAAW